mgnify:CR=1 FL=1
MIRAVILGAWLALFTSQAFAHQSSTYDLETSVSYSGEIRLWLINNYDGTHTYEVQVLDRDLVPTDVAWVSNLINNEVTLEPEQLVDIEVQVSERGKYYVCTAIKRDPNVAAIQLRSRVCLRLWYR